MTVPLPAHRRTGLAAHSLRLTLVRHGETAGQSSVRYYGRTDVPLSAAGREQMRRVGAALTERQFGALYSSTLSRATEAALIISNAHAGRPTLTPVAGFNEIDFGEWEGLTTNEIRSRHPRLYAEWAARLGDFQYPGGERVHDFRTRIARTLHDILAQPPQDELLFVLHKGVIRCIVAELLGTDEVRRHDLRIEIGSIHVVSRRDGVWRAEGLDQTAHLG